MRGRGGGMDEVEQDKSPLASHCHRPKRACTRGVLQSFRKWKQGLWMGASRNDLSFSRQCRQVPKPSARRGRTPNKHKKPVVMPTSQNTAPDATFYAPKPTNNSVDDDMKKLSTVPEKSAIIDNIRWISEQRTEDDVELSGSVLKGLSTKYGSGKKLGVSDENRRKTYKLSQLSTSYDEFPILSTFDQERELVLPLLAQFELRATVEGKFELVNRFKEEGKGDNGLLVRPKAAEELKEERVKISKRDPSPD